MKIYLVLLILCITGVSCSSESSYTINGTIEGAKEGKVYLRFRKEPGSKMEIIDTVRLLDGKFNFTGTVEDPIFCNLYYKGDSCNSFVYFFLENSDITIKANSDLFSTNLGMNLTAWTISGSGSRDEYKKFQSIKLPDEIMQIYNKANETDDDDIWDNYWDAYHSWSINRSIDFIKEDNKSHVRVFVLLSLLTNLRDTRIDLLQQLAKNFDSSLDEYIYMQMLKEKIDILSKVAIGSFC